MSVGKQGKEKSVAELVGVREDCGSVYVVCMCEYERYRGRVAEETSA